MNPHGVVGFELTGALAAEAHGLAGAVGHVGDQLVVGAVGEGEFEHCLCGGGGGVFLHVFKIVDWGLVDNPLNLKRV